MGSQNHGSKIEPRTLEERLVYWSIVGTWALWLTGLLYILSAVLGYVLLSILGYRILWPAASDPEPRMPPPAVLAWIAGTLAMAFALIAAHIDYDLGAASLVKSFVGWIKGWALLAVYPLVGATMSIRPEVVSRATCLLCVQTLLLIPFFILADIAGAPKDLYLPPWAELIGTGNEFFEVSLFGLEDGRARYRFYAPWSTAAAFVASLGLVVALQERSWRWRIAVVLSTIAVCNMAGSRTSVIVLPATLVLVIVLANLWRPSTWLAIAALATASLLMSGELINLYQDATDAFAAARAASSRVRTALGNIAVHRWLTEAPIFGHGILDRGGQVVERMLIGSHHTWWGLLFVKGAVGFLGLALPFAWSFIELTAKAQCDRVARLGLGILVSIMLFSMADNIEIIAYLIWPALVFLGIAFRRRLFWPTVGYLVRRDKSPEPAEMILKGSPIPS